MSDVSAEDVQNLRQLRYEEMQKIKSQLKEQDQKWQDVSILGVAGGRVYLFDFSLLLLNSMYPRPFPCYYRIQFCIKCDQLPLQRFLNLFFPIIVAYFKGHCEKYT